MVQRQGSQHLWANPHVKGRDFSLVWTDWTCQVRNLWEEWTGREPKATWSFLTVGAKLRTSANTALLGSSYPKLIPLPGRCVSLRLYINFLWRLRSTCAAGSTMT